MPLAPGTFQGAMNSTLAPGLRKFVLVFFDDILVYSKSWEDHIHHLALVFQWLSNDQWQLKFSKCKFGQQSISYLGHVISATGLATDPTKIQAIQNWLVPTCVKDVRGFLGLAGYYRKFVKNLASLLSHSLICRKRIHPFTGPPCICQPFSSYRQLSVLLHVWLFLTSPCHSI
jgi:hypothetical protein